MPLRWPAQLSHLSRSAGAVRSVCPWEGRDREQDAHGRLLSHVTMCFLARHWAQGKYGQASGRVAFLWQSQPRPPKQRRGVVSHLLLLTFPLFTAHCRDTPFDSAAHTWPSASFCSAVLLLKIASACPGSTASLHKLWGGWGWRRRGKMRGEKGGKWGRGALVKRKTERWWWGSNGQPFDHLWVENLQCQCNHAAVCVFTLLVNSRVCVCVFCTQ